MLNEYVYYRMKGTKPQLGIFHNSVLPTRTEIDSRGNAYYLPAESVTWGRAQKLLHFTDGHLKRKLMERTCLATNRSSVTGQYVWFFWDLYLGAENGLVPHLFSTQTQVPSDAFSKTVLKVKDLVRTSPCMNRIHRPVIALTGARALGWSSCEAA